MARLDAEPDIISIALGLKLDVKRGPVSEILRHCRTKIEGWVSTAGGADSLARVEQIVCENLSLVFEEVWTDDDLMAAARRYIGKGEMGFAHVPASLDEGTFATLMERLHAKRGDKNRYVAFIDCRTREKAARRFFTRWHEIAHLLTLVKQLELPFHRSTGDDSPLERLMDAVAGEVAFHPDIFQPALEAEIDRSGFTFDAVERVRRIICPEASYQATLIACAKRAPFPVVHLEIGMGYKKDEQRTLRSRQMALFATSKPVPKLRVLRAAPNESAKRAGLTVHQNMQVPEESIVTQHFRETEGQEFSDSVQSVESLSMWKHSDGSALGHQEVFIEVKRIAGGVQSLVQQGQTE